MTIKKPRIEMPEVMLALVIIAGLALTLFLLWTSEQTRDECGSLPLSAYTNPDDTTPAKCYAMWKDGRL